MLIISVDNLKGTVFVSVPEPPDTILNYFLYSILRNNMVRIQFKIQFEMLTQYESMFMRILEHCHGFVYYLR